MNEFRIELDAPAVPADPVRPPRASTRLKVGVLAVVLAGVFVFAAVNREPARLVRVPGPHFPPSTPDYVAGPCGESLVPPAISGAESLTTPTGIKLLVGGRDIYEIDLDSGDVVTTVQIATEDNTNVVDLALDANGYVAIRRGCGVSESDSTILTGEVGGTPTIMRPDNEVWSLLTGGDQIWTIGHQQVTEEPVTTSSETGEMVTIRTILSAADGTAPTVVPDSYNLISGYGKDLVALTSTDESVSLSLVRPDFTDAAQSLMPMGPVGDFGGFALLTNRGSNDLKIAWTSTGCLGGSQCTVRTFDLRTKTRSIRALDVPDKWSFAPTLLSPDGNLLLGRLEERSVFESGEGSSGFAVADLRSGELTTMPGLSATGYDFATSAVFSPDSKFLVFGVNSAKRLYEFYVWKPGTPSLLRSPATLDGPLIEAPMVVLP